MPDKATEEQLIEKPEGTAESQAAGGVMVTMPKEYRHGALGKKMAEPKGKVAPTPVNAPVAHRPVPKPVPRPTIPEKPGMATSTKVLIVAGSILLIGLGIGAFILVRGLQMDQIAQEETPPATETPPVTRPEPPVTPTPDPTPEPVEDPESPFPNGAVPGTDSDSDGLTDVEERLVYGTNHLLPDTDSDGFLDGNEVFHRYNPVALAPGTLLESGLVVEYNQQDVGPTPELGYVILYPSIWTAQTSEAEPINVVFLATTGETISLSRMNNKTSSQSLESWMSAQGIRVDVFSTTTKNGYHALITEDQMTAYIDGGGFVLVLSYSTGIKRTVDYIQTFQMMLNSIVLSELMEPVPAPQPQPQPEADQPSAEDAEPEDQTSQDAPTS